MQYNTTIFIRKKQVLFRKTGLTGPKKIVKKYHFLVFTLYYNTCEKKSMHISQKLVSLVQNIIDIEQSSCYNKKNDENGDDYASPSTV